MVYPSLKVRELFVHVLNFQTENGGFFVFFWAGIFWPSHLMSEKVASRGEGVDPEN